MTSVPWSAAEEQVAKAVMGKQHTRSSYGRLHRHIRTLGTLNLLTTEPNESRPMTNGSTRIEQLEAFAQTILLAIDQLRQRQEASFREFQASRDAFEQQFEQQTAATDRKIAANAEQIAANTAGLIELRGILADYLRSRTDA
ncbi:MAG: hypothetical protein ACFB4J_00875 [Elainellaceae cyanobacterium]